MFRFAKLALLPLLVVSCSPKVREVTVVERHDTLYQERARVDSVRILERVEVSDTRLDSIVPILDSLGKVTGFDRWHIREIVRDNSTDTSRLLHQIDSLKAVKADIRTETKMVEVEKKLSWWQVLLQTVGALALWTLAIGALISIARKRLKL